MATSASDRLTLIITHMLPSEREALVGAADATVREIVDAVEGVHKAVAGSSFLVPKLLGPGRVPKLMHDAIAATTYASVRVAGRPVAGLLARALRTDESSLSDSRGGAYALATVGAWAGDRLAAEGNPLAVPMAVRVDGRAVTLSDALLRSAFPTATGTAVVFLHGLGETEHAWGFQPRRDEGSPPLPGYAAAVSAAGGTPVMLRFNTGEHVSSNGSRLSVLLGELVAHWPVPLTRLVLVGHSMGGLVIRSACHVGAEAGAAWVPLVSDTVSLGTPHHGASLERLANLGTFLLRGTPWSRPLGRLADGRSAGIKDLRYGNLIDADWVDVDPDELWVDRATDVPLLASARHHLVAASLGPSPTGRLSVVFGDLLVVPTSAHGQRRTARRTRFVLENATHLPGAHHFSLLNHPTVAALLGDVLGSARREAGQDAGGTRGGTPPRSPQPPSESIV